MKRGRFICYSLHLMTGLYFEAMQLNEKAQDVLMGEKYM